MLLVWCVFVGYDSDSMKIYHQVAINTTENFRDRLIFDEEDQNQLVVIKVYHTYNGVFNAL